MWDLGLGGRFDEQAQALEAARARRSEEPTDGAARAQLAVGYARRGAWQAAAALARQAEAAGAALPPLVLAELRWRGGDLAGAARLLERARGAAGSPPLWLDVCLGALERELQGGR